MTEQNALVTDFAKSLLRINIEASIRCGKAETGALTAYHALAGNAAWAAYRLLLVLHEVAPDRAAEFLPELIEEVNDGEYLADADEVADELGVDVRAIADRVEAENEKAEAAR